MCQLITTNSIINYYYYIQESEHSMYILILAVSRTLYICLCVLYISNATTPNSVMIIAMHLAIK